MNNVLKKLLISALSKKKQDRWWLSGGVLSSNCVAAYQPKGAISLAASYINLNMPGTYDASLGVAPGFVASGWRFLAPSLQYLKTGVIPNSTFSAIFRYSNLGLDMAYSLGSFGGINTRFMLSSLSPSASGKRRYLFGDKFSDTISVSVSSGVMAMSAAGTSAITYFDGSVDTLATPLTSVTWSGIPVEIYIGTFNNSGVPSARATLDIQAVAFYNIALSAAQILAITTAMQAI